MTPKQAAEQAVRCFDAGEQCGAGIWPDIAQELIWEKPEDVLAEQRDQLAWEEGQPIVRCWDCLLARRAIVKLLEEK